MSWAISIRFGCAYIRSKALIQCFGSDISAFKADEYCSRYGRLKFGWTQLIFDDFWWFYRIRFLLIIYGRFDMYQRGLYTLIIHTILFVVMEREVEVSSDWRITWTLVLSAGICGIPSAFLVEFWTDLSILFTFSYYIYRNIIFSYQMINITKNSSISKF